jgi:hypothetical protein
LKQIVRRVAGTTDETASPVRDGPAQAQQRAGKRGDLFMIGLQTVVQLPLAFGPDLITVRRG